MTLPAAAAAAWAVSHLLVVPVQVVEAHECLEAAETLRRALAAADLPTDDAARIGGEAARLERLCESRPSQALEELIGLAAGLSEETQAAEKPLHLLPRPQRR